MRALVLCLLGAGVAQAHEMRPSLLDLRSDADGRVEVTWKVALAKGQRPDLRLVLPEHCQSLTAPMLDRTDTAETARWTVRCVPWTGATVHVEGLRAVGTEVFVRHRAESASQEAVLRPDTPSWTVPNDSRSGAVGYFGLGVWHILIGADHLLFVLGLVLVVGWARRRLLLTITAFTLGHSVTLAAASLGWVVAPIGTVEAVIALSILYLAAEAARDGPRPSHPWGYALLCGGVHGLGFASALDAVGLPADSVVSALLFFNLGVEAGQLAFIAAVFVLAGLFRSLIRDPARARRFAAYGLGLPAGFWVVDRVTSVFLGS